LNSTQNRDLIADNKLKDFIVSGKLTGMLMAQTSLNPELLKVFHQLLDKEGKEIVILSLSILKLYPGLTCAEAFRKLVMEEKAFLGFKRGEEIYLCPNPTISLEKNDEPIIILESEEYSLLI
ncbi:MAG: CASTOR/POLLUX-related putative ion channel, partial [Chitinophagaceae bacterium]